jgi:hypothetical protein
MKILFGTVRSLRIFLQPTPQSVNPAPSITYTAMILIFRNSLFALWGSSALLAQETSDYTAPSTVSPVSMIIWLLVVVLMIAAMWKIFTKAGQPGWASIIPIYNMYIWCKIVGRPGWWVVLLLIPFVNFVIAIILCIDLAKSFGKGVGFGIGIILLGIVFLPILAFSGATYQGPSAGAAS